MSVFVTNMASMIGIGVAVDYSLFVVARYREEVRAGRAPEEARAVALATSGLAVLFSGLTVIISLAGLWMLDNTAIRSMALGAMLVVAVAMLGAVTLLPALIALLGRRVQGRSRLFSFSGRATRGGRGFWQRWTDAVMRRPVLAAAGSAAVLLALAAPVLGIETKNGALDQFPRDHEVVRGFEAATEVAGAGASSPVHVVAQARAGASAEAAAGRVRAALERERGARCCSSPRRATTRSPTPRRRPSSACARRCRPPAAAKYASTSAASPPRRSTSTT
jgi:uncharacterized membrane protein YdfJ with MMPL/SSD domain